MNHWTRYAEISVVAAALVAASTSVVAGPGERDEDPEGGLIIFGFVKDARGAPVADARVSAQMKGGVTFYVTTTRTGAYRFPFFNSDVNPADIVIACSKVGYKQTRVTRRPVTKKPDGSIPAETECRLEQG